MNIPSAERTATPGDVQRDNPDVRPLRTLAKVAVPSGLLLLGIPVATGLPVEPFVLLTLVCGLIVPAVILTRRDPTSTMRSLLRDCIRVSPRAALLLVPALTLLPALTWAGGQLVGHGVDPTRSLVTSALWTIGSSLVIVNIWEEMVWQGFVQRRAAARWGFLRGSLFTTLLFVGVHLPLAFAVVDGHRNVGGGLAALVVSGIGLRLLLGAVDLWSGRSILAVAVLHASFNAAADFVDPSADWVRYAVTFGLGLLVVALTPSARGRKVRG